MLVLHGGSEESCSNDGPGRETYHNLEPKTMSDMGKNGKKLNQRT